ncbi:MAG: precorrin-2 C(20)-methyltransferase [Acidimicrobiales bacterium]|nr:precorrin-2 C(20)-methyltransferase [Acidimicrobiales bacterium]
MNQPDRSPKTAVLAPQTGRLFGVGVGPGDPDLLTRRAVRVIEQAEVVAHFAARRRPGNSLRTIESLLRPEQIIERLEYPVTTEAIPPEAYRELIDTFYAESAARVARHLDAGRDVAVLSEGDPFFYGSYMHLHVRLAGRYPTEVVPGVTAFSAASAAAGMPVATSEERFTVLPGILPHGELVETLRSGDAVVIMKVGRHLPAITEALRAAGRELEAVYVERASFPEQRVLPITDHDGSDAPYFSLVLVPGRRLVAVDALTA